MQKTKEKLLVEREKLRQEQEYVGSPFYLEQVARNELHLSKLDETIVIVPQELIRGGQMNIQIDKKIEKTNWQKWFEVFSGKI